MRRERRRDGDVQCGDIAGDQGEDEGSHQAAWGRAGHDAGRPARTMSKAALYTAHHCDYGRRIWSNGPWRRYPRVEHDRTPQRVRPSVKTNLGRVFLSTQDVLIYRGLRLIASIAESSRGRRKVVEGTAELGAEWISGGACRETRRTRSHLCIVFLMRGGEKSKNIIDQRTPLQTPKITRARTEAM